MDAYETSLFTTVLITGILLGIIIILFAWSIIRSQKRYFERAKEEYKTEIELMEERNRIARDLHDELGPILWMVKIQIQKLKGEVSAMDELLEIERNVEQLAKGLKRIAVNLMPATFLKNGLTGAINDLILQFKCYDHVKFEVQAGGVRNLPLEMNLHIIRIMQELLQNSIKHSNASLITIKLTERRGSLLIFFADNGKGMDHKNVSEGNGMGLNNIKDRTVIIGGTMHSWTKRGKGTFYLFEIPVSKWKASK